MSGEKYIGLGAHQATISVAVVDSVDAQKVSVSVMDRCFRQRRRLVA
jgi:hypothetical protein